MSLKFSIEKSTTHADLMQQNPRDLAATLKIPYTSKILQAVERALGLVHGIIETDDNFINTFSWSVPSQNLKKPPYSVKANYEGLALRHRCTCKAQQFHPLTNCVHIVAAKIYEYQKRHDILTIPHGGIYTRSKDGKQTSYFLRNGKARWFDNADTYDENWGQLIVPRSKSLARYPDLMEASK